MILAAIGIFAGVLIALETLKNWRSGKASTAWAIYSREERPRAFKRVIAVKAALSVLAVVASFTLIVLGAPR